MTSVRQWREKKGQRLCWLNFEHQNILFSVRVFFFFFNEGSNQSTVTCSVLFILKNYSVKSSKWIKWIKKKCLSMGLNLTDTNQSRSTHLYLPSSPHCIFQKYVVNIVQHMKRFVITGFYICVYMYSWDWKCEFNTPQEWLHRHQGLMSIRRRNRLGLLIQQTLCTLHKINKRKPSVGNSCHPLLAVSQRAVRLRRR